MTFLRSKNEGMDETAMECMALLKKHGIFYADESKSRFLYWNGKLMEKRFLDAIVGWISK